MSGTITKILSALAALFRRNPSPATTQAVTGADDLGCDGINTGPCAGF
jgi:hypothetical protein